jgi:hypothetical protein
MAGMVKVKPERRGKSGESRYFTPRQYSVPRRCIAAKMTNAHPFAPKRSKNSARKRKKSASSGIAVAYAKTKARLGKPCQAVCKRIARNGQNDATGLHHHGNCVRLQ